MQRIRLEGIFVPHITPFTLEGKLDEEALRTCVRFWMNGGVSGLMPCGSNGEAPYLSREERRRVIETVVDEANGKVQVIAGTGSMSTWETIQFTEDAKDLGVDAKSIPNYNAVSAIYNEANTAINKFSGYAFEND